MVIVTCDMYIKCYRIVECNIVKDKVCGYTIKFGEKCLYTHNTKRLFELTDAEGTTAESVSLWR